MSIETTNRGSGPTADKAVTSDQKKKVKPIKEKDGFYFPTPAQLERFKAPWAKNALPSNTKAVILISSTGNVETGLTQSNFDMHPIEDLMMCNRADQFAKDSVRETKKTTLQCAAAYMAKAIEDNEGLWNSAPRTTETGFETLAQLRALSKNAELLERSTNTDNVSKLTKQYLLSLVGPIEGVLLDRYKAFLVYDGDKKTLDLRDRLLKAHIPNSVFTKLTSTTDIIQSTEHDITRVLFPKNASKHLALTIAECRDDELIGKILFFPTVLDRSGTTIRVARERKIQSRAVLVNGVVDPALEERYLRQIVTIVGPGPLHLGWAKPIPSRPVNSDVFAGEILQINKENVDFHLGVVPFGLTANAFWDNAVIPNETYAAGLHKSVAVQASESGIPLVKYARDKLTDKMYYRVQTILHGRALNAKWIAGFETEIVPPIAIADQACAKIELDKFDYLHLKEDEAKRVTFKQHLNLPRLIAKLFLRPIGEKTSNVKKEFDRPAQVRIPRDIADEIKEFVREKLLNIAAAKKYSSYLTGFHSVEMLKKAHVAFASKIEELDLNKALETNPVSDDEN